MNIFLTEQFGKKGTFLKVSENFVSVKNEDLPDWAKPCWDAVNEISSKSLIAHFNFVYLNENKSNRIYIFITNKMGESRDILTIYADETVNDKSVLSKEEWKDLFLQQLEAEKTRYNSLAREAHQRYVDATRHAGGLTWSV